MIDFATIRRDNPLPAIAGQLVPLKASRTEWVACCPFHADRTPSFTIYNRGQRFCCFGCGASGDVLDFVQRAYGVDLPEAARMLGAGQVPQASLSIRPDNSGAALKATDSTARSIYERAKPASGTLAEAYLRWRGIDSPVPADLRFLALPCDNLGPLPCLVAGVRNVGGEITGVQRIWLAPDGLGKADVAKPKRSLGQVKGGAIRLAELDGTGTVAVCEGPEDGLSLLAMLGGTVWVAAGASFLPYVQFPAEVRSVIIGADNDPAGADAAFAAAQAYAARGLHVRILRPLERYKDFNDELRGTRDAGSN